VPRLTARARGYDSTWDRARTAFLAQHPTCELCGAPSTIVHHRIPHRMGQAKTTAERDTARRLFWSKAGWVPVCQPCHDGPCDHEDRHGYSNAIGNDGLPTDPRHPFNRG
jgi:5-methylcytosine-specific restriction protein A